MSRKFKFVSILMTCFFCATQAVAAEESSQTVRIKDITSVEGIRDNPLMGYGVVVGLSRTGDSQQTVFSIQTLSN